MKNRTEYYKEYRRTHKAERAKYVKKYRNTLTGYLYLIFHNMKERCDNPNHIAYKYYGGRGIKCLFVSSQEFVDYVTNVMKIDPRGLDTDRINNDGHYEIGNIRFITHKENMRNRKN